MLWNYVIKQQSTHDKHYYRSQAVLCTCTYHFIGPKGPTPGLIIERINIELSSFANPWMLRFTAILIRCRVIVIQRFRSWMIAFQTPTVRLKAIIRGLDNVAVVRPFVILHGGCSSSCCCSVGAVIHRMMTVRVGRRTHITVCGCLIVTSAAHLGAS